MNGRTLKGKHGFAALAVAVIVFGVAAPRSVAATAGSALPPVKETFWVAPPVPLAQSQPGSRPTPARGAATPSSGPRDWDAAPPSPNTSSVAATTTGTRLAFRYASGWSGSERAALAAFIATAYPILVDVAGPPARSFTVTIVPDDTLNGWAYLSWSASRAGAIVAALHVGHAGVADADGRLYYLPHEILHAFHAPYTLPTDADEEGMTEATATLVRERLAPLVGGVAGGELGDYNGQPISELTDADELNQPVLAARSFHNSDGSARPQVTEMYAAAAAYWLTLAEARPTLFRDFNTRWYRAATPHGASSAEAQKVQAIVTALVPQVGSHTYADWSAQQQIQTTRHAAGVHLVCSDFEPQLTPDPSTAAAPSILVNTTLVVSSSDGDDTAYDGSVGIVIVGPDGTAVESRTGEAEDGSLFALGYLRVPGAGAYRFRVTTQSGAGRQTTSACWVVAGISSAGRLLVIGTPGGAVTATFAGRDAATGSLVQTTATEVVGANGIATFEGAEPGLADVGPAGGAPVKVVPVGTAGAIVTLIPAT